MSWPSSNFHHDSFEYINPPRPEYKPSSFHISHNTYINFKGPSDSAVKTAGWLNFAGGIFNGLANLGSAFLLSKGNGTGAQAMQIGASTIGNLLGGGGFNGYGTGFGGAGWGGTGGGYLIDQTYYRQTPIIPGSPVGNASGTNSGSGASSGSGAGSGSGVGSGSGAGSSSGASSGSGAGSGSGVGSGSGAGSSSGASSGSGAGSGSGTGSGSGSSGATGNGKVTADYFNKAIDDKLDRNNDGKVDKNDIFSADVFNSTHNLGHTTSKVGDATGIRRGVAASKTGNVTNYKDDEKTSDGFYKYITVTDKDSSNEWTFEYVKTDGSGNPVYRFSPSNSDLSKDDNGSNKNWESTGRSPEYTVTIDAKTGEIKMASSGNEFSASKKGHLGRI